MLNQVIAIYTFLLLLFLFPSNNILFAQSSKSPYFDAFSKLPFSAEKTIEVGQVTAKFQIRAIKHKNFWIILTSDTSSVYSIVFNQKSEKSVNGSFFFNNGILRILKTESFKIIEKEKKVDGIEFKLYFKLKGKAKKQFKILQELEEPRKKESFFKQVLAKVGFG